MAYLWIFMQDRKPRNFTKVYECLIISGALIVFVSAVTSVLILFDNLGAYFFSKVRSENKSNTGL